MARTRSFKILIATDGSQEGTAGVNAAVTLPWPAGARGEGVVVRSPIVTSEVPEFVLADIERSLEKVAAEARKALARRWRDAEVRVIDGPVVDAIVGHVDNGGFSVAVLGSRGHGPIARLLVGSTSLGVVRRNRAATLVVRGTARGLTRVVLAFDGSPSARNAVKLLERLDARPRIQVTIVRVLEQVTPRALALLPSSARQVVAAQAAAVNAAEEKKAARECEAAAAELRRAGFKVDVALRKGAPLHELLAATERARAQLLVLGARGHSVVERLLLGSVAEGGLHRCPVSVLVTR